MYIFYVSPLPSSINRAIQFHLRDHHGTLLGIIDTTVHQLITTYQQHTRIVWKTNIDKVGIATTTTTTTSTSTNKPAAMMVRKATVYSRLLDLPRLAANAGVERRLVVQANIICRHKS